MDNEIKIESKGLKEISDKLGIAVEQIFKTYAEGVKKSAVIDMCAIVVALLGSLPIFKIISTAFSNDIDMVFSFLIISLVWCLGVAIVSTTISRYYLNEYEAIKEIIQK